MTHLILVAVLGVAAPSDPLLVQPGAPVVQRAAADPVAAAYAEFMLARQLADRGDVEGAVGALQRAMTLDPKSSDLPAELAGLYARQNRAREAIEAARAALAINPGDRKSTRLNSSH